jgi:hypothetical protein
VWWCYALAPRTSVRYVRSLSLRTSYLRTQLLPHLIEMREQRWQSDAGYFFLVFTATILE